MLEVIQGTNLGEQSNMKKRGKNNARSQTEDYKYRECIWVRLRLKNLAIKTELKHSFFFIEENFSFYLKS